MCASSLFFFLLSHTTFNFSRSTCSCLQYAAAKKKKVYFGESKRVANSLNCIFPRHPFFHPPPLPSPPPRLRAHEKSWVYDVNASSSSHRSDNNLWGKSRVSAPFPPPPPLSHPRVSCPLSPLATHTQFFVNYLYIYRHRAYTLATSILYN